MSTIAHVELSDTFNTQRNKINALIDHANSNPAIIAGDGIIKTSAGVLSVKKTGDGLSFDYEGNLVGNDAYPNLMTQVVFDTSSPAPAPTVITSTTITFPAFSVIFDNKVYYGKRIADFTKIDLPETVMTVEAGVDGAVFVYVDTSGEIHQSLTRITPNNSSTQCLLGSYFRLNNQIQANSWAYTPWNGSTSKDTRFTTFGSITGGLITQNTTSTLSRGSISVILEGVNATNSIYTPNYKVYAEETPYSTKKLWPGYDASVSDTTTLDTTHIYNMTDETVDDISSLTGYIILIPGIVAPTGQDVYLMAMSPKSEGTYTQVYTTMNDAISHIYGLQVSLGNVASRVLWLNQAIIVKIGATDFTDSSQLTIIGQVPNVLAAYSSTSSGGSGSRVTGLTIKAAGTTIGSESSKTVLDFTSGFTILNSSENSVSISTNATPATYTEVNTGTDNIKYVTPLALAQSNYITEQESGMILKQIKSDSWPLTSTLSDWPHTLWIAMSADYIVPQTLPTTSGNLILTWEVVLRNTTDSTLSISWPNVYQGFNNEALPTSLKPNTSLFMMMRKYTNNFALVSVQGYQSNSLL